MNDMVDLLFLYILFLGGGTLLMIFGFGEIAQSGCDGQWVDFKKRRIGLICFGSGMLMLMLSMIPIGGGWGVFSALGFFLLVPTNEFSRIAWELPYYEEEKIKKAKQSRVLVYVLFVIVELVALRLMLGSVLA